MLKYLEYYVVYFVVANNIESRAQIKRLTTALLLTAFIVALVAMAQIPSGERVTAPFEGERGEPNTLGGYLLFMCAVAAGLALQSKRPWERLILGGLVVFMLIPFGATLSRGSYLGLPFVYLGFVFLHQKRRATMLILLVVLSALGAMAMPQSVRDRITYTFSQRSAMEQASIGGVELDTSTTARIESWKHALSDVMSSPLWGFGVTGGRFLDAMYPRILVETGFLGLGLFTMLILAVFKESLAFFRRARDSLYKGLAMALFAGLVGLLVHAVGANTFIIVRIMEPFWLVVGLVISAAKLEAQEQAQAEAQDAAPEAA